MPAYTKHQDFDGHEFLSGIEPRLSSTQNDASLNHGSRALPFLIELYFFGCRSPLQLLR